MVFGGQGFWWLISLSLWKLWDFGVGGFLPTAVSAVDLPGWIAIWCFHGSRLARICASRFWSEMDPESTCLPVAILGFCGGWEEFLPTALSAAFRMAQDMMSSVDQAS